MYWPFDFKAVGESELSYRIASIIELKNPEPCGLTDFFYVLVNRLLPPVYSGGGGGS